MVAPIKTCCCAMALGAAMLALILASPATGEHQKDDFGVGRRLLQQGADKPTVKSMGTCPDGGNLPYLITGVNTIRARHGAGEIAEDPGLNEAVLAYMNESNVCAERLDGNPKPFVNATSGIVGVGYIASGNPLSRGWRCIQAINGWYQASVDFQYDTPVRASGAVDALQTRTSNSLAFMTLVWNSTVAYGCGLAECSDPLHNVIYCYFQTTDDLPVLLEEATSASSSGDSGLRSGSELLDSLDAAAIANVFEPLDTCPFSYTTKSGEGPEEVARQFNISVAELVCFNNQVGQMMQLGLGNVPVLIPCPGTVVPARCPEYDWITASAPTWFTATPADGFAEAGRRFGLTGNDVCCYNPAYNLTGQDCSAPTYQGFASIFIIPEKSLIEGRNCTTESAEQQGVYDCPDPDDSIGVFNDFRKSYGLKPVQWDKGLANQAKEFLNRTKEVCDNPYATQLTYSDGLLLLMTSGLAHAKCASAAPIYYWSFIEQVAFHLGLFDSPTGYEGLEDPLPGHAIFVLLNNQTSKMGCAMVLCGPYYFNSYCLWDVSYSHNNQGRRRLSEGFSPQRQPLTPITLGGGHAHSVQKRLQASANALGVEPWTAEDAAFAGRTLLQKDSDDESGVVGYFPPIEDCPKVVLPLEGELFEEFAERVGSTVPELVCYHNQMRLLGDDFKNWYWYGAPVAVPCPGAMGKNVTCDELKAMQGTCGTNYTADPADTYRGIGELFDIQGEELCCYNQGMGAVLNDTCKVELLQVVEVPCNADLSAAGCTEADIRTAELQATESGDDDGDNLGLILGLAVGIPLALLLLLLGCAGFLVYNRRKGGKGAAGAQVLLKDGKGSRSVLLEGLDGTNYDWELDSAWENSNSVVVRGQQRTGAMLPVVAKFSKNKDSYVHEREFYRCKGNPQHFPEWYEAVDAQGASRLPYLVLERGDTTLREWLTKTGAGAAGGGGAGGRAHVKAILADVGEALRSLHGQGAVHGDVKPENLLFFTRTHRWKLIDFGAWAGSGEVRVPPYTLRYSAPEVLEAAIKGKEIPARVSADMWSYGMLAWECMLGEHILDGYTDDQVRSMLLGETPLPFEADPGIWQAIKEEPARRLLHALLQRQPNFRWEAGRVLDNAYFREGEDTVMTYRKFASLAEQQSAVLNKLEMVAGKIDLIQAITTSEVAEHAGSAMMVCCALMELLPEGEEAVFGLLEDGQEKDPHLQLYRAMNDGDVALVDAPVVNQAASGEQEQAQVFMMRVDAKYVIKIQVTMCNGKEVPIESIEAMTVVPDGDQSDGFTLPLYPLHSACSKVCVVGTGLWDPAVHSHEALRKDGAAVPLEIVVQLRGKDGPIYVKPQLLLSMHASEGELPSPEHLATVEERWEGSAPAWVRETAFGASFFYNLDVSEGA